jgi:hypothetical protein
MAFFERLAYPFSRSIQVPATLRDIDSDINSRMIRRTIGSKPNGVAFLI